MRTFYLTGRRKDQTSFHTLEEQLRDNEKREVIMMGGTIEELDKLTSLFPSFEVLNEELKEAHNSNIDVCDPIIIVDPDDKDLSQSYAIFDIVYEEDKKILDDRDNIKLWLLEYLRQNPEDISRFKGIRNIYQNKYTDEFKKGIVNEDIIRRIVLGYFENEGYKKYRDIYFELKKLDRSKVKKDEIHR